MAFQNYAMNAVTKRQNGRAWSLLKTIVLWAVVAIVFLSVFQYFSESNTTAYIPLFLVVASFIAGCMYIGWEQQRLLKKMMPIEDGFVLGKRNYVFDEAGFTEEAGSYRTEVTWRAVIDVVDTDDHIFLVVDAAAAYILPKRDISGVESDGFLTLLRQFREGGCDT